MIRRVAVLLVVLTACTAPAPGPDAGVHAGPPPDAGAPDASSDAGEPDAGCTTPPAPVVVDCDAGCPAIAVAGDPPASAAGSGNFRGYADPSLMHDPAVAQRVWLAYSYPHAVSRTALDGGTVYVGAVSSHLARSDDQGATFTFVRELYASNPVSDPEGSGEQGLSNSETVSLAWMADGGTTTWYAAHLRYFQRPIAGYNPKYGTSWTVHVGAAATPQALGDPVAESAEAVLGVSTTAAVYGATTRLDQLAGLPVQRCAMLNNPALFVRGLTLYLLVECLAFSGSTLDFANTTAQLFATTPSGPPVSWTWRHAGTLAGVSLAQELQDDTVQQYGLTVGAGGAVLVLVTPAHGDPASQTGVIGDGCVALELASLEPPVLRRDCAGRAVVRARLPGPGVQSCAHDAASVSGLVPHVQLPGTPWRIVSSGLRP